jgi:hypothetical protein
MSPVVHLEIKEKKKTKKETECSPSQEIYKSTFLGKLMRFCQV